MKTKIYSILRRYSKGAILGVTLGISSMFMQFFIARASIPQGYARLAQNIFLKILHAPARIAGYAVFQIFPLNLPRPLSIIVVGVYLTIYFSLWTAIGICLEYLTSTVYQRAKE